MRSKHGGPFLLDMGQQSFLTSSSSLLNNMWTTWHKRLGHLNNANLLSLFKLGYLNKSMSSSMVSHFSKSNCESCCLNKSHVLPFPIHYSRSADTFDVVHTDVWGIAPTLSRLGYKYYVTFIDDHCRYTWIYFLKFKSKVFSMFQKFCNMVSTQFQKSIKVLRSDSRGEYTSTEFQNFLAEKGIIHKKNLVPTHHNKMEWQNEKIVIS